MAKKPKKQIERQEKLKDRLAHKNFQASTDPMLSGASIRYEMTRRIRVLTAGGIGAIHQLVCKLKLPEAINQNVEIFKRHLPYFESDHVLSICYSILCGGKPLEDVNRFRLDEVYLDALGTTRVPAPSTAGDFLRRFDEETLLALQEAINQVRVKVWKRQSKEFREKVVIDLDGTLVGTQGECKEGIEYSYKKIWGYGPLLVSIAGTREALYVVNRPANVASHQGVADWIDRALCVVNPVFETIWLRGDADFSLTKHFDVWDPQTQFIFGYDAKPNLIKKAELLPPDAWTPLHREKKYEVKTKPRKKPKNIKQDIVKQRGFLTLKTIEEEITSFDYQPTACKKSYRMIVLKKHLKTTKGEEILRYQIRYFFYITNDPSTPDTQLLRWINKRCNQENTIEQLKNGVPAFHAPADTLLANWAYMIIASLAWNLKAWYGLLIKDPIPRQEILNMEFKQFLNTFIFIPCQVISQGRQRIFRIAHLTFNTLIVIDVLQHLQKLRFP